MKKFVQLTFFVFVWVNGFGQELKLKLYSAAKQRKIFSYNPDFVIYTIENKTDKVISYRGLLTTLIHKDGFEIEYKNFPPSYPPKNDKVFSIAPHTTQYQLIPTSEIRRQYSLEEVNCFNIVFYLLQEGKDKVAMKPLKIEYNERKITDAEEKVQRNLFSAAMRFDDKAELIRLTFELMPKNDSDWPRNYLSMLCYHISNGLTVEQRNECLLRFLPYFDNKHDANVIAFLAARDYQKEDRQNSTLNNYLKKHKAAFKLYKKVLKQEHGVVVE